MQTLKIATIIAAANIANGDTLTVEYPNGTSAGTFLGGKNHKMLAMNALFECPKDFTLDFGASNITVTYNGATTIPLNSKIALQLDVAGEEVVDGLDGALTGIVAPLKVVRVELGSPLTSDDDYFRANAAVGGAGALTLLKNALDVPRNVIITSAGNDSGITFDVVGTDVYGAAVKETITGANAGVAAGKKAFKSVTSVTASGAAAGNVKVGFGDVLGLPVYLPAGAHVLAELQDNAAASAGTKVAGLAVTTKSTATTADVRGTYDPNAACDGDKGFALLVALEDPTFKGNPQFAG